MSRKSCLARWVVGISIVGCLLATAVVASPHAELALLSNRLAEKPGELAPLAADLRTFIGRYSAMPDAHADVGQAQMLLGRVLGWLGDDRQAMAQFRLVEQDFTDVPKLAEAAGQELLALNAQHADWLSAADQEKFRADLRQRITQSIAGSRWGKAFIHTGYLACFDTQREKMRGAAIEDWNVLIGALLPAYAAQAPGRDAAGTRLKYCLQGALGEKSIATTDHMQAYCYLGRTVDGADPGLLFAIAQSLRPLIEAVPDPPPGWIDTIGGAEAAGKYLAGRARALAEGDIRWWEMVAYEVPDLVPDRIAVTICAMDTSGSDLVLLARQRARLWSAKSWKEAHATTLAMSSRYAAQNRLDLAVRVWDSQIEALIASTQGTDGVPAPVADSTRIKPHLERALAERYYYSVCGLRQYVASKPTLDGNKAAAIGALTDALMVLPKPQYPVIPLWTPAPGDVKATEEYLAGPAYDRVQVELARWRQLRKDMPAQVPEEIRKLLDKLDDNRDVH